MAASMTGSMHTLGDSARTPADMASKTADVTFSRLHEVLNLYSPHVGQVYFQNDSSKKVGTRRSVLRRFRPGHGAPFGDREYRQDSSTIVV